MAARQVKSKERVTAHGEVFTAEREVKAMCDLVKSETERIESRFLEPACGNGNFNVVCKRLVARRSVNSVWVITLIENEALEYAFAVYNKLVPFKPNFS